MFACMHTITRLAALSALTLSLTATPALASTTKVSGKVKSGAGLTVVGIGADGTAVRQKLASSGKFALTLKSGRDATLHLLDKSGGYYGPIVLAKRGRAGYEALSGRSTRIGPVVLAKGFARAQKAPAAAIDRGHTVILGTNGAPLGASRHGLVLVSKRARLAAEQGSGQGSATGGGDTDRDGLPDQLDLDANGNGRLDNYDSNAKASGSGFFSELYTDLQTGLNVDASPSVDQAAIDHSMATMNQFGLNFFFDDGRFAGRTITGAHVDCGTLVYCRRGSGTAIIDSLADGSGLPPTGTVWTSYAPDGSGFPNLTHMNINGMGVWAMPIHPQATSSQIKPGDTFDVVFDSASGPIHVPTSLTAYFVTTPAIAGWGGRAPTNTLSYPVSDRSAFQLGGDQLTLSIWRPQRQAIPGAESGTFIDQGHLHYGVVLSSSDGRSEYGCGGHYSNLSSTLSAQPVTEDKSTQLTPLLDAANDAAPDRANTMSFTVDLGACLRAQHVDPSGQEFRASLMAAGEPRPGGMDRAVQMFSVRFP
jgi:hypothetical protein